MNIEYKHAICSVLNLGGNWNIHKYASCTIHMVHCNSSMFIAPICGCTTDRRNVCETLNAQINWWHKMNECMYHFDENVSIQFTHVLTLFWILSSQWCTLHTAIHTCIMTYPFRALADFMNCNRADCHTLLIWKTMRILSLDRSFCACKLRCCLFFQMFPNYFGTNRINPDPEFLSYWEGMVVLFFFIFILFGICVHVRNRTRSL